MLATATTLDDSAAHPCVVEELSSPLGADQGNVADESAASAALAAHLLTLELDTPHPPRPSEASPMSHITLDESELTHAGSTSPTCLNVDAGSHESCCGTTNESPSTPLGTCPMPPSVPLTQGTHSAETLALCLKELNEAETRWGPEHPCVALALRHTARSFEMLGRGAQTLPLWIRVLQIERRELGPMHADIMSLEAWIRDELQNGTWDSETAEAYAVQLKLFMKPKAEVPSDDGGFSMMADDGAGGWAAYGEQMSPRERSSSIASSVGVAVVGGALHVGMATASSTAAATASVTASAAQLAGSAAVGAASAYASGGTAAEVAAAAVPNGGWGWAAAGLAGRAATAPVRSAAGGVADAAQHTAISATASATTSAISCVGSTAYSGAAWAAGGAWSLARRRFSASEVDVPEESATAAYRAERRRSV